MTTPTTGPKPRTISDLGADTYIDYARRTQATDLQLIRDSQIVPTRTEVPVTRPYAPSESAELFSTDPTVIWAIFSTPPGFESQSSKLFGLTLLPFLTSYKLEAVMEKLHAIDDESPEKQTLLSCFKEIEHKDRMLALIFARIHQYKKG